MAAQNDDLNQLILDALGSDRSSLAPKKVKDRDVIPASEIQSLEKKYKVSFNKNTTSPLVYGDLKDLRRDPISINKTTIFNMNCVLEKIPIPSTNKILGMGAIPKNIINRNGITTYINNSGEEIEYPTNYMKSIGGIINLTITGDIGANYDLVVKDITNTKWYDWDTNSFTNGYTTKQGVVDYEKIRLIIPPKATETKYQIFFQPIGSTDYSSELPTESNPWEICQLMDAKTTFRFDSRNPAFISDTVLSKTYKPGTIINTNENGTTIDCTLTVLPKRGRIKLINEDWDRVPVSSRLFNSDVVGLDKTTIFKTDLVATVNSTYSMGTISGTITLNKSAIRDYNFSINPTNFFKII